MQWDETDKYREIKKRADAFNNRMPQWVRDANEKGFEDAFRRSKKHPNITYWRTYILFQLDILLMKIKALYEKRTR